MFTWVCPTCGRELDLATKECPNCAGQAASPPAAERADKAAQAVARRSPPPTMRFWLLVAAATLVAVLGLILFARYRSRPVAPESAGNVELQRPTELPPPEASRELPAAVSAQSIEVAGIRTSYDSQNKPQVRALVINHGEEPLVAVTLNVTLRPARSASASSPLGRFTVKISREIKPGESQEVRAPLDALATLAAMPPWHQLRADVEVR